MIEAALLSTLLDFEISMRKSMQERDLQRRVSVMPDYMYIVIFIRK